MLISLCAGFLRSHLAATGRWAVDTLSNDDALDLLAQNVPVGSVDAIHRTFDATLIPLSPSDDERAAGAVTTTELVAAIAGSPSRSPLATCASQERRIGVIPHRRPMSICFIEGVVIYFLSMMILIGSAHASSVSYTYYANGRLWKAIYDNGTTVMYFYDAAGNRTKVTVTCSGTGC